MAGLVSAIGQATRRRGLGPNEVIVEWRAMPGPKTHKHRLTKAKPQIPQIIAATRWRSIGGNCRKTQWRLLDSLSPGLPSPLVRATVPLVVLSGHRARMRGVALENDASVSKGRLL